MWRTTAHSSREFNLVNNLHLPCSKSSAAGSFNIFRIPNNAKHLFPVHGLKERSAKESWGDHTLLCTGLILSLTLAVKYASKSFLLFIFNIFGIELTWGRWTYHHHHVHLCFFRWQWKPQTSEKVKGGRSTFLHFYIGERPQEWASGCIGQCFPNQTTRARVLLSLWLLW